MSPFTALTSSGQLIRSEEALQRYKDDIREMYYCTDPKCRRDNPRHGEMYLKPCLGGFKRLYYYELSIQNITIANVCKAKARQLMDGSYVLFHKFSDNSYQWLTIDAWDTVTFINKSFRRDDIPDDL